MVEADSNKKGPSPILCDLLYDATPPQVRNSGTRSFLRRIDDTAVFFVMFFLEDVKNEGRQF